MKLNIDNHQIEAKPGQSPPPAQAAPPWQRDLPQRGSDRHRRFPSASSASV